MSNIIIGTAGHVDHGKTCLIEALTGIETDRLAEEKKRGITIELGFAYLDLPNGEKAGIIDVPGHEKFIKNMLAGAGGMDMVLLVIAANEGIMPQTKEHLAILSMLNIENGIVVLTKSDLVEEDWLEFVIDDIKSELEGSFLKDAQIIPVSSHTGSNIDKLKQEIFKIVEKTPPKSLKKSFRIPVDRVFTVNGFGTVITGTLIEGTVAVGDSVAIYPDGLITKVRNLQVHSQDVETAYAGQRVAVNLAKVKKSEVSRGDTLAQANSMEQTNLLDVKLNMIADTPRTIEDRSKLHLYHGTRNILCKVVLFGKSALKAGESCYAQLKAEEDIAVKAGDRFIVRFYSPVETLGGGEILDANPKLHRRHFENVVESLRIKENGTPAEKAMQAIIEYSPRFKEMEYISKRAGLDIDQLKNESSSIGDQSSLIKINDNIVVHANFMEKLRVKTTDALADYHEKNPLQTGMRQDELKHRLMAEADFSVFDAVLNIFTDEKHIKQSRQRVALYDFEVSINKAQQSLMDELEKTYLDKSYSAPTADDLKARYPKDLVTLRQVLGSMLDNRVLIRINEQIYLHKKHLLGAVDVMAKIQQEHCEISLGEFRDGLETSRKYALPILEYCDKLKVTQRTGDLRKLADKYLQKLDEVL